MSDTFVETRPYEVPYEDLNALIDALQIAVEKTRDRDHRRILLGALMARRNNDRVIDEATNGEFDHVNADDFIMTEAERQWFK